MIEPGTGLTILGAASALKEPAAKFFNTVLAPSLTVLGERIAEHVKAWTEPRATDLFSRAFDLVEQSGQEPKAVTLKIILPLVDGAVLEEDEEMKELWAALLANAFLDTDGLVRPIHVSFLNQPSAADARVLSALSALEAEFDQKPQAERDVQTEGISLVVIRGAIAAMSPGAVQVSINALIALGLVSDIPTIRWDRTQRARYGDDEEFRLSPMGREFIRVCSAPAKRSA